MVELLVVLVILAVIMGVTVQIFSGVGRSYESQRQLIEAQHSARAALDSLVRLIRLAGNNPRSIGLQAVDPDPDGNALLDSIQIQADWNPADGALNGPPRRTGCQPLGLPAPLSSRRRYW